MAHSPADDDRSLRRLAMPVWGVLLVSILTFASLVYLITQGQDRVATGFSRQMAGGIVENLVTDMKHLALETGYWDQAVNNLITRPDEAWARDNITDYLYETYQIHQSYVIDPQGQIRFLSQADELTVDPPGAVLDGAQKHLVARVLTAPADAVPVPLSAFYEKDGLLWLATAIQLTTYLLVDGEEVDRSTGAVLLIEHRLDPAFLLQMVRNFPLRSPQILMTEPPAKREAIALAGPSGETVGWLVWEQELPGSRIYPALAWSLVAVMVVMAACFFIFLNRAQRLQRELAAHEHEMELQSDLLTATINSIDQGIAVWSEEDRLLAWNRRCEEFWYHPEFVRIGMSKRELLGHISAKGVFGNGDAASLADRRYREIREAGTESSEDFDMLDGAHIHVSRHPMPDGSHTAVYTDVSERQNHDRQMERARFEAEEASRAKSAFIANMSHELRTPLNAIIGFSDIMCSQMFGRLGAAKYEEYVADIKASGQHLLEQINQILDLSKIESGKLELRPENQDVGELIDHSIRMVQPQIEAKAQRLDIRLGDGLPQLHADRKAAGQILVNLLSNASKFTPEKGLITVAAEEARRGIKLSVTDTGIGMAPDLIKKVGTPFLQAGESALQTQEGTGLGLSIVKSLVDLHGGQLKIESTEDQGTTVTALFPFDIH